MSAKKRDYASEYKNYHSRPEQKLNRAARNKSRNELKKQGKEPCDTCYTMMEPDDPRIPENHCISLTGCAPGTNMYGE